MLGFSNFWIGLFYLLSILSGIGCVVYGFLNWNKGEEEILPEDRKWAEEENIIDKELE